MKPSYRLFLIVNPERHFSLKREGGLSDPRGVGELLAFDRSKHLLEDLFERASLGYEWPFPTMDV